MIPAGLSFHDATIAAIRREGTSYILDVEDVAVAHGEDVVNGTLTFEDVRRILVAAGRPASSPWPATTAKSSSSKSCPAR